MQERVNRGEKPGRTFRFTGNDFFRITGTKPTGGAYDRLEGDADPPQYRRPIKTNLLDDDGEGGETAGLLLDRRLRDQVAQDQDRRQGNAGGPRSKLGSTALQSHHEEQAHPDLRQPSISN